MFPVNQIALTLILLFKVFSSLCFGHGNSCANSLSLSVFVFFKKNSLVQNTGSMDGAWSDAISVLESEFDDEFYSVYDGMSYFYFFGLVSFILN